MKTIKHRILKTNPYFATCFRCGCVMLYNIYDVHFIKDDNNNKENEYKGFIFCPRCGNRISHYNRMLVGQK